MSGQQDGRDERLRETASWLNAIPVTGDGRPMLSDPDRVDPGLVEVEVEAIRIGLASGAGKVECFITRFPVVEAIMRQLTGEELERVSFPGVESQIPST